MSPIKHWRPRTLQWLVSGGYLILLVIGLQIAEREAWLVIAALIAGLALFAWQAALRRARAIADTPTSSIASAAQGYVELLGRGRPDDETPLIAPLSHQPCLWYRYQVQRRQGNKWVNESSGESDACFVLEDDSGRCRIEPGGAEILPGHRRTWREGDKRFSEALILVGEQVYALGAFDTWRPGSEPLNRHQDVGQRLAEWKKQPGKLLARFDLDGNGQLDLDEWALARAQARREIDREHQALLKQPGKHWLRQPADGRLFLISTLSPARIERRFRWWAFAHAGVFMVALSALGWLPQWPF